MFKVRTRDWFIELSPESHPDELVVEISSVCNLSCAHCFRRAAMDLNPRQMDLSLFKSVVTEASKIGVKKIVFSGWGEPLTHPDVDHMMRLCKSLNLRVSLNTNGVMLSNFIDLVIQYVDELYISLDAIAGKSSSFTQTLSIFNPVVYYLKEITRVKQLRGSLKPKVIALYTVTKLNVDNVAYFLELAKDIGVNEVLFSFSIPSEGDGINCLDSFECVERFYLRIGEAMNKFKELGLSILTPLKPYTPDTRCPFATSKALFVRSDGAITPCIYYAYSWASKIFGIRRRLKAVILGYVGRDSIVNVWREKYAKMFYRLSLRKATPSCLTCVLVEYCVKTRSNEVDCLGGEPNCGHCPFYHGLTYCPL